MTLKSALHELAMATFPEEVIVVRLAREIVEYQWGWRTGYYTDIRKKVKDSRPPWGQGKKRLEAVIAEMDRQSKIRRERILNAPVDWASWSQPHKQDRRTAVLNHLTGLGVSCQQLKRYQDRLVMLCGNYNPMLIILQPDGSYIEAKLASGYQSAISGAVLNSFMPKRVTAAMMNGASVEVDFVRLATILHHTSGDTEMIAWEHTEHPKYKTKQSVGQ